MNKKFALFALLGTLNLAPTAFGQYFYLVNKEQRFDQMGTSSLTPDAIKPFQFVAQIGGNGTNEDANTPAPPNTVTAPGNPTPFVLSAPSPSDSQWTFKLGFNAQSSMDTLFPNGDYLFTTGGNSGNINVSGDLYTNSPTASFNVAGTWSGNVYSIFAGQSLTINTNSITGFSAGNFRVGIDATPSQGFSGNVNDIQFDSLDGGLVDSSGNITIPSIYLQPGQTWDLELQFNAFSSFNGSLIPNGAAVGMYTERTHFEIAAIPEPAETVLIASSLALGVALWRRRRTVKV